MSRPNQETKFSLKIFDHSNVTAQLHKNMSASDEGS